MRCLSRMGLGLVGLALVTPSATFADPPYSYTRAPGSAPSPYSYTPDTGARTPPYYSYMPDTASPPPRRSLFHKVHLCAKCQRAELQAKGIAVPAAPALPKEGMVPSQYKCDRCGGVVAMVADPSTPVPAPVPALSAVMAPPTALTLSESPAAPAPGRPPAPAYTWVPPSAAPAPPALASSPPLVPGPASGPAWASVPGSSSIVVASMAAPAPTPAPPTDPGLLASNRTRSKRKRSAAATSMASTGSPANACEGCAAAAGGDAAGHALVGGTVAMAEPTPIGVIQGRYAYQDQSPGIAVAGGLQPGGRSGPGANTRGPGSSDPSVMPSSFNAEPYDPVSHNRPHILSHVFGLDAIGRHSREANARRRDEKHASIPYQTQGEQPVVGDLPAKMVYGR